GDYLRKPFEMKELLQRLSRVVAVHQRQREAWKREQRLQRQLEWAYAYRFAGRALRIGDLASQMARSLQLEPLQVLELQWAAALVAEAQPVFRPSGWIAEALESWQENWNGSGPRGLSGDSIPLAGRIVRLAVLAADCPQPEALLAEYEGQIDPHLL